MTAGSKALWRHCLNIAGNVIKTLRYWCAQTIGRFTFNTVQVLNLSSSKLWVAECLDSIYYATRAEDREFKSTLNRMFFVLFFFFWGGGVNGYLLKIELIYDKLCSPVDLVFILFSFHEPAGCRFSRFI